MIIECIKDYIKTCPFIKRGAINVNYLGADPIKYTIDNIPAKPLVKRYVDGSELRQYLFAFASREAYDANALENMDVAKFFESFEDWIAEQDSKNNLPVFADSKFTATKIEVISSGYLLSADETTARFQVELKLTYRKDR